jgi:peptide/nickel transport system substrate-binding protein
MPFNTFFNFKLWKDIEPAKNIEFKIKKGIKWHDGNELKIP